MTINGGGFMIVGRLQTCSCSSSFSSWVQKSPAIIIGLLSFARDTLLKHCRPVVVVITIHNFMIPPAHPFTPRRSTIHPVQLPLYSRDNINFPSSSLLNIKYTGRSLFMATAWQARNLNNIIMTWLSQWWWSGTNYQATTDHHRDHMANNTPRVLSINFSMNGNTWTTTHLLPCHVITIQANPVLIPIPENAKFWSTCHHFIHSPVSAYPVLSTWTDKRYTWITFSMHHRLLPSRPQLQLSEWVSGTMPVK